MTGTAPSGADDPAKATGTEFDDLAALYDRTRGGEPRGDEYAADIDRRIPPGDGPILEIGVGTGVVALGPLRRGRRVAGLDLSAPMLDRAFPRLGPVLVRADASAMPLSTASAAHAVSVWVLHAVDDPVALFAEAARVIRPGGRYVVCSAQHPHPDDRVGQVISDMARRVDTLLGHPRPRGVTADEVAGWAATAGFTATLEHLSRAWWASPADELEAIERRAWPAMRRLDDAALAKATAPAIEALASMSTAESLRRAVVDLLVLTRP